MVFKLLSQVRNKNPDNCITVQPVSFVEYKLNRACQGLKSWAGRARDWKWLEQIAAAAIFKESRMDTWMHFYTFTRSSCRSLWINNKQHAGDLRYNYPLWSISLVTTMRIRISVLSGEMAFVLSLSCRKPSHGAEQTQSSLEIKHVMMSTHCWHIH